jgi:acyl-CoA synthetase (AMP-forming)/AMP-acid ligase II
MTHVDTVVPELHISKMTSLPEVLRMRSQFQPDEVAFVFLADGEDPQDAVTYRQLDRDARRTAAMLHSIGLTEGNAVLIYPPGVDFVRGLLGCMYAGVAGVPVQVPTRLKVAERIRRIADDAGASVILTCAETRDDLIERFGDSPFLDGLTVIATDTIPATDPGAWSGPLPEPSDTALLQYTSGSTGDPKGVMVTHANFLANVRETDELWPVHPDGTFLSWLPHFHDMGMLFGIIMPLWAGAPSYLMAPAAFIRRPARWLEAISRFRATHSAAPSFAYELCVRAAEQHGVDRDLDLSGWRVAANGAEPVRWSIIEQFTRTFAPVGFRPEAMCPGYGLAENTLKASGSRPGLDPGVLWVSADALREDRVEVTAPHAEGSVPLVGNGISMPGTRLRIVEPATRQPCPPGRVGEIWISGPCVAGGYYGRPAESGEVFQARLADAEHEGPYLRTGDLGFQHGDELYVAGRLKDVIIRKGRNFYPQDIELAVESTDDGLMPNCSVAFSVDDGTSERLVVIIEADGRVLRRTGVEVLRQRVQAAVHDGQRLHVDDIMVVRRGALPKTSSGKVQRRASRMQYLEGSFESAAARGGRS